MIYHYVIINNINHFELQIRENLFLIKNKIFYSCYNIILLIINKKNFVFTKKWLFVIVNIILFS